MTSTPLIRVTNNENATSFRGKPGMQSVRRAFQDRDVNNKFANTPLSFKSSTKKKLNVFCDFGTPATTSVQNSQLPQWMTECSYKPIKDTYSDIMDTQDKVTKDDVLKLRNAMFMPPITSKPANLDDMLNQLDPLVWDLPSPSQEFSSFLKDEAEAPFVPKLTFNDFDF